MPAMFSGPNAAGKRKYGPSKQFATAVRVDGSRRAMFFVRCVDMPTDACRCGQTRARIVSNRAFFRAHLLQWSAIELFAQDLTLLSEEGSSNLPAVRACESASRRCSDPSRLLRAPRGLAASTPSGGGIHIEEQMATIKMKWQQML
jgi:hypothetical protein